MKLSFSISSKPSSRPDPAKAPDSFHGGASGGASGGGAVDDGEPRPQFVTVFDPSKTLASDAPTSHVIPPIPNADLFHPHKKMKNLLPHPPSDDPTAASATQFVLDTFTADPAAASIPFGLSLRSNNGDADPNPQHQEGDYGRRFETAENSILRKFQEDMKNLPDDRGFDEFDDVPVESFGAAILAGYGWSEGKGLGRKNKGDTKVVEYDRRAGTAGLGYTPSPNDPKASKRKGQSMPLVEKRSASAQIDSEKIVRVISGWHAGLKAKVVERSETSGVVLKLLQSGDEVTVGEDMVTELGSVEEEKCLKRLKELEIHGREERREQKSSRDSRRDEKSSRYSRREEKSSRSSRRDEKGTGDEEAKQADGLNQKSSSGGVQWLASHIRVRIISRDFRGGKLYKKKGKVVDVVSPTTCVISMDESRELVQGVDQEILETALPKLGGSVLVLYGKYKGVFGNLVERNMEEEMGVVRDADSHALINVCLDQIAEYVGDPSYVGY